MEDRKRWYGNRHFSWLSFCLLFWLNLVVAWCIVAAEWTRGLGVLPLVAACATILGTMLTVSRWPGVLTHLYSLVAGSIVPFFAVASLLPERLTWHDRSVNLGYRIAFWVRATISGQVSTDVLMFILALSIILWWTGYFAAWQVFRRNDGWWAVIPGGANVIVNLYYGPPQLKPYIVLYAFIAFLLILWLNFKDQEREWAAHKVGHTPYIALDFFRYGLLFIAIIFILAWVTPEVEARPGEIGILHSFRKPWEHVQKEWNRLFPSLRSYRGAGESPIVFGKALTLGGPVSFGERLIMEVETTPRHLARYWKAATYDFYTGRGWLNTDTEKIPLGAGDYPPVVPFEARIPLTQTYYIVEPQEYLLFSVYQPAKIIIPAWAYVSAVPSGDDKHFYIEPSLIFSRQFLGEGKTYKVVSLISRATEEDLRNAGTDYPEWVLSRYLQLPEELPKRVRDLAQEITAPYDNPYDKATAIERYLRQNIAYNEGIQPAPEGRDAVDYFLFDLREGYCNYYASAMVVMARAVGIPARLAAGYALGEHDPKTGRWKVRDKHSHSWVEVYFPRYGWVEFEPTSAQPPIVRPIGGSIAPEERTPRRPTRIPEDVEVPEDVRLPASPEAPSGSWWTLVYPLRMPRWLKALVLSLIGALFLGRLAWKLLEPPHLSLAARLYLRLYRLGRLMGIRLQPHHTPHEYAFALTRLVPQEAESINTMVDLYVKERFGGYVLSSEEERELRQSWRRVLPGLMKGVLFRAVARATTRKSTYDSTPRGASSHALTSR